MKEYIITCKKEHLNDVIEQLQEYTPKPFNLLVGCAIRIQDEQEPSLLEILSVLPDITYRQALTYHALEKPDDRL